LDWIIPAGSIEGFHLVIVASIVLETPEPTTEDLTHEVFSGVALPASFWGESLAKVASKESLCLLKTFARRVLHVFRQNHWLKGHRYS
jgi:hypothetical protein